MKSSSPEIAQMRWVPAGVMKTLAGGGRVRSYIPFEGEVACSSHGDGPHGPHRPFKRFENSVSDMLPTRRSRPAGNKIPHSAEDVESWPLPKRIMWSTSKSDGCNSVGACSDGYATLCCL